MRQFTYPIFKQKIIEMSICLSIFCFYGSWSTLSLSSIHRLSTIILKHSLFRHSLLYSPQGAQSKSTPREATKMHSLLQTEGVSLCSTSRHTHGRTWEIERTNRDERERETVQLFYEIDIVVVCLLCLRTSRLVRGEEVVGWTCGWRRTHAG